jgi:plasmid stabilization system protein ParE
MKIIIEKGAEHDLQDGLRWYRKRSDQAADRFLIEFDATLNKLLKDPTRHRQIGPNLRVIHMERYPYRLIYRVIDETQTIKIYAAAHDKRRPDYWQRRTD